MGLESPIDCKSGAMCPFSKKTHYFLSENVFSGKPGKLGPHGHCFPEKLFFLLKMRMGPFFQDSTFSENVLSGKPGKLGPQGAHGAIFSRITTFSENMFSGKPGSYKTTSFFSENMFSGKPGKLPAHGPHWGVIPGKRIVVFNWK